MNENFKAEYLKKAKLSYPPLHITIGVTSACNNKCLFCAYHGEAAKNKSNVYGLPFMLSLIDFKKIVNMAKSGGVKRVHICGTGEPFYNPDILKMIDYVIETYGKVSLQTNFALDLFDKFDYLDAVIKRGKCIEYITTDICSGEPSEHDFIKRGSKYDELLDSLEYISKKSNIKISLSIILTKTYCSNLDKLLDELLKRNIKNVEFNITNLFSYDFSEYTSSDNVYISTDIGITKKLNDLRKYGESKGIKINIPFAADQKRDICRIFWEKFQTWPAKGCDNLRYGENMVPIACAAVVKGDLNSLGYLFDYNNIMDAWNNEKLVEIRQNLLNGRYPSEYCKECYLCNSEDNVYKLKVKGLNNFE